ncbi:XdhC family protein [Nonomuraea sp. NN258]|uniref:XdhC family protein n=1 Tax=Nonomuraea antri TaxID=2730852 RepID=UPI0015680E0B|nr:XdhC/CoxI family protein [Nonomuraea antri]NRQ35873.1 XdhC family protein [Nonomuraea antri]
MRELVDDLRAWIEEGCDFAVASVVGVGGSAPRQPGAALAVSADGTAVGSVSGGCVEGAVYELCLRAIEERRPLRQSFGYSDSDAFAVGLTCGGTIDVLVWPVVGATGGALPAFLGALARDEPAALVRPLTPGAAPGALAVFPDGHPGFPDGHTGFADGHTGGLGGGGGLDRVAVAEARAMLDAGLTGVREICHGDVRAEVFVETCAPPPAMLVFGAIDFAAALTRVGRLLGYHVTVCDARPVFATRRRFPDAHEVVVDWPHRFLERTTVDARTVIAVLTHDAKFDVPLLRVALRTPAGYIGAMGSRRTHDDRLRRLREAGTSEAELGRLRSPIGLDLGARTPEETALSIAAEIVATRRGGTGLPLTTRTGPIHTSHAA